MEEDDFPEYAPIWSVVPEQKESKMDRVIEILRFFLLLLFYAVHPNKKDQRKKRTNFKTK